MNTFERLDVKSEIQRIKEWPPAISAIPATKEGHKYQKVAGIAEIARAQTPDFQSEYTKPYLDKNGTLVIPFTSHPRYHWWKGGQDLYATLKELDAPLEVIKRYVPEWFLRRIESNHGQVRASQDDATKGRAGLAILTERSAVMESG